MAQISNRQTEIVKTSIIGIVVNLFIALLKIIIGAAASSIAIISEGINNATDAASSFLTLVGTKLSQKHPDDKHPFGYGRIEYLTGLVVSILIIVTSISLFRESISSIIHPSDLSVNYISIAIVAISAIIKLFLGNYTIHIGEKTESDALKAVGSECRNDSFFSIVTILSAIIFIFTNKSIDGWVGVIFAIIIIKSGIETLIDTLSSLIGSAGERELAVKLYKEISKTDGIISVADMMLHNYGPNRFTGSANVEIDHKKTIGEAYEFLHALQLQILNDYNVVMVFGIYAVDRDSNDSKEIRSTISAFIRENDHIKSFHALYLNKETNTLYVDFIVDYNLASWETVHDKFIDYMKDHYPDYKIELVIETEYV